jgi:hypothetical protein
MIAAMTTALTAAPLFAQEQGGGQDARGYVTGLGGFAASVGNTTGDVLDAGYRYSRIGADTTLSASPVTTNGMTFGFGYRF